MVNRYPLVLDTADKKLKELPIGDNLRVDGDIVVSNDVVVPNGDILIQNGEIRIAGQPLESTLTINYSQLTDVPNIPTDLSDLTDNNDLLVITELRGINIFGENNTVLVNGVDNNIPYSVLSGTPTIPSDISQLSDSQGLLSGDAEITAQSIESALGYVPYDGGANPIGFITTENDTLSSVVLRGNSTDFSISVNGILTTNAVATDVNIRNSLEFFDNNETNQFNIVVETGKVLSIGGRLTVSSNVSIANSEFLGDSNSSIGSVAAPWSNVYASNLTALVVKNQTSQDLTLESQNDIVLALSQNKRAKVSGIGLFQLPKVSTAQRNLLTPQTGDVIYNTDASSVQIYVGTVSWSGGAQPEPIPGWVSLYTPPPPPA